MKIVFDALRDVSADEEALTIDHAEGRVVLFVGKRAASWREMILHPTGRLEKFGFKPDSLVAVVGVLPDHHDFLRELHTLNAQGLVFTLDAFCVVAANGPREQWSGWGGVVLSVRGEADISRIAEVARGLPSACPLWIVRPTGASPVRESNVRRAARAAGLQAVKVVRYSNTHTADKFVHPKPFRVP